MLGKAHIALAVFLLSLPACQKEETLPGVRETIRGFEASTTAERLEPQQSIRLPPPIAQKEWRQYAANAAHHPGHIKNGATETRLWKRKIGAGNKKNTFQQINFVGTATHFYVLSRTYWLYRVDAQNGRIENKIRLSPQDKQSLGGGLSLADDSVVIVALGDGSLSAHDGDSLVPLWETRLEGPIHNSPAYYQGRVYVQTANERTYALQADTGKILWRHQSEQSSLRIFGSGIPAIVDSQIVVGYGNGALVALSSTNGEVIWASNLATLRRANSLSRIADIHASPVIAEDTIYASSFSGRLVAHNLQTGERLWEYPAALLAPVSLAGNVVFAITAQAEMLALSAQTGSPIWITPLPEYASDSALDPILWSRPVLAEGQILLTNSQGFLYRLNPVDGTVLEKRKLGKAFRTEPVIIEDTLYLLETSGVMQAWR